MGRHRQELNPDDAANNVARTVILLMNRFELTPLDFANEIGLSQYTIQAIVKGNSEASSAAITAIANRFAETENWVQQYHTQEEFEQTMPPTLWY